MVTGIIIGVSGGFIIACVLFVFATRRVFDHIKKLQTMITWYMQLAIDYEYALRKIIRVNPQDPLGDIVMKTIATRAIEKGQENDTCTD